MGIIQALLCTSPYYINDGCNQPENEASELDHVRCMRSKGVDVYQIQVPYHMPDFQSPFA